MTVTLPLESIIAFVICAAGIGWTICYMFTDPQPIDWEAEIEEACTRTRHLWKIGETYCFCGAEAMKEEAEGFIMINQ